MKDKKMPNIFTILDEIEFEKDCERLKFLSDNGALVPDQFMFSVIQKFYEKLQDKLDS